MVRNEETNDSGAHHMVGFLLLLLCVPMAFSLIGYAWQDIAFLRTPPNDPPRNPIGLIGAWFAFLSFMTWGVAAYLLPLLGAAMALCMMFRKTARLWPRFAWGMGMILASSMLLDLNPDWMPELCAKLNLADPGGLFGSLTMRQCLVRWLNAIGAGTIAWALFAAALVMTIGPQALRETARLANIAWHAALERIRAALAARQNKQEQLAREARELEKKRKILEKNIRENERDPITTTPPPPTPTPPPVTPPPDLHDSDPETPVFDEPDPEPEPITDTPAPKVKPRKPRPTLQADSYVLPSLDLLEPPAKVNQRTQLRANDTSTAARILEETLSEFGIEAKVTNVEVGPVVTNYELLPAPGIRVERITGLSNNLALVLKATAVRVQAPIPGKGVVGIEVPNSSANVVYLREIMEGETWRQSKAKLPLALGKDVGGNDLVADLAAMPHMLIAGATGAGKTVCMNSVLAGLLLSRTPQEMRLMLIDPKIVEFSVYNELPHLVVPVITDAKKVAFGLRWAITEMEKRYKMFAKAGVRNIASFNSREIAHQEDLFDEPGLTAADKQEIPDRVPYIVIVIDELADLMLAAQAEIENYIARLAQLSRAVGIHMIIATQRPSVNVITGTIKANFPARLAFQVAQKVDSRTILDTVGADKLLGRGDMLFMPPGSSKLIRAQGAMTTDDEIRRIVDTIKRQAEPVYELEIKERIEKSGSLPESAEDEDLIEQATAIIRETHRASTSSLQRRLRIGYTRAARLMDALEERGVVGPPRGSDPREILIDLDAGMPVLPPDDEPDPEDKNTI